MKDVEENKDRGKCQQTTTIPVEHQPESCLWKDALVKEEDGEFDRRYRGSVHDYEDEGDLDINKPIALGIVIARDSRTLAKASMSTKVTSCLPPPYAMPVWMVVSVSAYVLTPKKKLTNVSIYRSNDIQKLLGQPDKLSSHRHAALPIPEQE